MKSIITTIFLFGAFQLTIAQHGVGTNWGPEVLLPKFNSNAKQRGVLYNNIVTTSNGRIIVSTTEVNSSNINQILGHYLTYSDNGGSSWITPQQFTPTNLVIGGGNVKLAMDSYDTLYVLWTSKNPAAIFISKLDMNLNVIKDSIRVSSKITNYSNVSFATHFTIDRYNRIHVMWHEGNPGTSQTSECFYSRSIDGGNTWQSVDTLSLIDGKHSAYPHAEFDVAGDTLAICWRDSVGGALKWDVYGVVSTNGGQTWGPPIPFASSNDADWDPDLLIDNQGRLHLAYHVYPSTGNSFWDAHIKYKYSDNLGQTWQLPTNPPTGQLSEYGKRSHLVEGFRYDIQHNVLWVTWKDERDFNQSTGNEQSDMVAVYSTDRGLTWSLPEFVTDRYDSLIAFKAGALLPNGDFCVNYEVISPGDINDPNGFLRVYFRKRTFTVGVKEITSTLPEEIVLHTNYPNPFNPTTTIRFSLPHREYVTLKVFDVLGREVATLMSEEVNAGEHSVVFNATKLPSGVYFYRLTTSTFSQTKRIEVVK